MQRIAAIINLNHPAHIVNFWVVHLTLANVILIVIMLVVFALAILIPFPSHSADRSSS